MPDPVDLSFAIGLPPEKAIAYFQAKGYQIGWNWHDVWQEVQAKKFTVAKAARLDILETIRGELQRGFEGGTTLREFEKTLTPRLQALGWWGKQVIVDSRGNAEMVQLGSPRRLETIFRTNMQTAYMAGRYREMRENADNRAWWQYVAILDGRTRPAHKAMNGKVFHYDDPFWNHFYPPNGFNCRCRVRALSDKNLKDRNIQPVSSQGRLGEAWKVDTKTGFTERVATIQLPGMDKPFSPDLGWSYSPGKASSAWDKAGRLPDCGGSAAFAEGGDCVKVLRGQKNWRDYARPDLREAPAGLRATSPILLPAAASRVGAVDVLATALDLSAAKPLRVVQTPVEQVALRYEWLDHLVSKETDQRERYANFILPALTNPFEIYLTAYEDGYRTRYIGLFAGRNDLLVVVRQNADGSLVWNIMQADDKAMNKQRLGALLYGK